MGSGVEIITTGNILYIILITITITLLSNIHNILFSNSYSSIMEFWFEGDAKKTLKSIGMRVMYIIVIAIAFNRLLHIDYETIYAAVVIGSILNVWAIIIHYRLVSIKMTKNKIICLLSYITLIYISYISSKIALDIILPLIEGEHIYLLENKGVEIFLLIVNTAIPVTLEAILSKMAKINRTQYIDIFREEIRLLSKQLQYQNWVEVEYKYYIQKLCKGDICLEKIAIAILKLEDIYRGALLYRTIKYITCRLFPRYAIRRDFSMGLPQIKISTASKIMGIPTRRAIKMLSNRENSIEILIILKKEIIVQYTLEHNEEEIFKYIADNYLSSITTIVNRTALIYTAVLRSVCKPM